MKKQTQSVRVATVAEMRAEERAATVPYAAKLKGMSLPKLERELANGDYDAPGEDAGICEVKHQMLLKAIAKRKAGR